SSCIAKHRETRIDFEQHLEPQSLLTALGEEEVLATLRNTQLESLTPLQAMNLLYELKAKL
ncbi:MAG: hypothetical protein ACLUNZ_02355, partial [Evtepia sp.]